ncbi:MAG: hypothetical protein BroJett011_27930 [Chloroflexota bacterium]|nr:MAG: hypothetical protein BroJett011_27930 [Chloroflexota bacterium]
MSVSEKNQRRRKKQGNAFYLRYADDFLVAWNGPKEGLIKLKAELSHFLKDHLGLHLSEEKTHLTHITQGYDFLGFTVKRVIKERRGYDKLLFYPSKASLMKLKHKIKLMTKRDKTLASIRDKLQAMNYLMRGWANYHRHAVASATFSYIGSYAFKRMELWLCKKTKQRRGKVYRKYYRRHNGYQTWVGQGEALFHPGVEIRISYVRYKKRPNPYLDPGNEVQLSYHLSPYPGKRDWQGDHIYGEQWTAIRQQVLARDENRCRICGNNKVEVHHLRKHKPNQEHDPNKLITLCAACHRQARNPQSDTSRQLARIQA